MDLKLYDNTLKMKVSRRKEMDAPYFWAGDDSHGDVFFSTYTPIVGHEYCLYVDQYYSGVNPFGDLQIKVCFTYTGVC